MQDGITDIFRGVSVGRHLLQQRNTEGTTYKRKENIWNWIRYSEAGLGFYGHHNEHLSRAESYDLHFIYVSVLVATSI